MTRDLPMNDELHSLSKEVVDLCHTLLNDLSEGLTQDQREFIEAIVRSAELLAVYVTELAEPIASMRTGKEHFNISHELRGPATSILGHTRLLLLNSEWPLTELQKGQLERVNAASQNLAASVNRLFDGTSL